MRVDYPDPERWSPTGDPMADRARLDVIHWAALDEDFIRSELATQRLREVQGHDAEYWEREGWDLLIDYDRAQDVPGMVLPHGSFIAHSYETGERDVRVLEMEDGEPESGKVHTILFLRLARAGYRITGWAFLKSTNGWHAKVRLDPHPPPIECVALQSICGSDPLRETCNLERARAVEKWAREAEENGHEAGHEAAKFWRERWNVLYHPNPERKRRDL